MTDTFQQLFGIQRQSHSAASPLQSDGKAFRPSDVSDKVTSALDGYGKQMAATDKLMSGEGPPDSQVATGQVALNDASTQAVTSALTTAQQADQNKVTSAGKDQSNATVYAQRQATADKALADNLTGTTKLARSALTPNSGETQVTSESENDSNGNDSVSLDSDETQSSLLNLSEEIRHLKPEDNPALVQEMDDLSGAADQEDLG